MNEQAAPAAQIHPYSRGPKARRTPRHSRAAGAKSERTDGRQTGQSDSRQGGRSLDRKKSATTAYHAVATAAGQQRPEHNPSQVSGNGTGDNLGDGPSLHSTARHKVSHATKKHLITGLQVFIVAGVIVLLVGLVLLAGRIKTSQTDNHNDTVSAVMAERNAIETSDRIIICMLKVPVAQRTDDYAKNCQRTSQVTDPAVDSAFSDTTITATTKGATPTAPNSSTTTNTTPTPTQSVTSTQDPSSTGNTTVILPLNCKIDLLGIHLIC